MSRPWKGEPEAGNGIGAQSSQGRVHQGLGSALSWHRLARPWLRYLTPGAWSHMPGNPTLLGPSPQLPAATSERARLWRRKRASRAEQQGGYFRGEGNTGEGSPTNRGERLGGGGRGQGGRVGRRGQSRDGQRGRRCRRKGERVQKLGPESPSLAGCCKALLLMGPSGAYLAHLAAIQVGWLEKPVFL